MADHEERQSAVEAPKSAVSAGRRDPEKLGSVETAFLIGGFVLMLILRIVYAQHLRVDSDEPQHLHVVWAWANGLLQYRDVFDNHSPLFQMLCAPLFRCFGERADIIVPMRQAMLPLFILDLYFIYKIARSLGTRRLAMWTTLAAGFVPLFFLISTEFRTDDLWATSWLMTLMLATGGPFKGWRAFGIGLVFGVTFAVSMKSSLLLGSLGIAAFFVMVLARRFSVRTPLREVFPAIGLCLLGLMIVPGVIIGYFAAHGALHDLYYCTILHNTGGVGLKKLHKFAFHRFLFPLSLIVGPVIGYYAIRSQQNRRQAFVQVLLLLTGLFYYTAMRSFWPLITSQNFVPLVPVVVIGLAPVVAALSRFHPLVPRFAVGSVLVAELTFLFVSNPPWVNACAPFIQNLEAVLRLTNPGDYVMDAKGETIFRQRPFYYVLEGITNERIKTGLTPDLIQQRIIETRTCVLLRRRLPKADDEWARQNFVFDADKIGVAGQMLGTSRPSITFSIVIPAEYTFVSSEGAVSGTLDGKPLQPSQFLEAGTHQLNISNTRGKLAVIWSQAVQRGYSIFTRQRWTAGRAKS